MILNRPLKKGVDGKILSADMQRFASKKRTILSQVIAREGVTVALDGREIHDKLQDSSLLVSRKAFFLKTFSARSCSFSFVHAIPLRLHTMTRKNVLKLFEEVNPTVEAMQNEMIVVVGNNHNGIQLVMKM